VLGHEGVGVVERIGSAVTKVSPGDRVSMTFDSCGACPSCRTGRPSYCHTIFEHNFAAARPEDGTSCLSRDGELIHGHFFGQSSFATHAVAGERNVVKIESPIGSEIAAPFGCGVQTGAGAVLTSLAVPAGSSIAVFGTGTVGLAAVMAGVVTGATTIVGVDIVPSRLELALELGATAVVDARTEDPVERIRALTRGGANFALETTGVPAVLRQAVDCTAPLGECGVIGAPAFGSEVVLDVNTILTGGRVVRGIVEGDSVAELFIPRLMTLWEQGRFPVDRLVTTYDFDRINEAVEAAESGAVVKPVLLMR
jgi:aryl-alcohol dehydrogenase